jgi:hypothetical protein
MKTTDSRAISALYRAMTYLQRDMDEYPPFSEKRRALNEELENLRAMIRRLENV